MNLRPLVSQTSDPVDELRNWIMQLSSPLAPMVIPVVRTFAVCCHAFAQDILSLRLDGIRDIGFQHRRVGVGGGREIGMIEGLLQCLHAVGGWVPF